MVLFSAVRLLESIYLSDIVVGISSMSMHEPNVVNNWKTSIYIFMLLQLSEIIFTESWLLQEKKRKKKKKNKKKTTSILILRYVFSGFKGIDGARKKMTPMEGSSQIRQKQVNVAINK